MTTTINASTSAGLISSADTSGILQLQTANTAAVTIDASQNVGIGTSSPSYKLDVTSASDASLLQIKSTASANNTAMRFGIDGNNSFINASGGSTGVLQLRVFGTTQATLDASGNLGLGVTPTGQGKFQVYTSAASINGVQVQYNASNSPISFACDNSNGDGYIGFNTVQGSGSTQTYAITNYATKLRMEGGAFKFYNAPSGTAGNAISFTQAMTLDASGNLALGTTSAGTRLVLATSDADTAGQLRFARSVDVSYYWEIGRDNNSSGAFIFSNAAGGSKTERARIDSSGNLLVGATATVGSAKFLVEGSVADDLVRLRNTNASPFGLLIQYPSATPNGVANGFLECYDSGGQRATIRSNGGLANYSANNVNLSDERTKTDIQDAGSYLAKICAIPVRTFKYKDQTDDLLNLGVIAQEVEAVAPELVDVSGFGETPEDGVPLKAIYQTDLQYALMKCIQEQQAIIQQLQADVAALKGTV